MNTAIQYLQIGSALYILAIAGIIVMHYLGKWSGAAVRSKNLNGPPAVIGIFACVICAVSTLVML